MGALKLVRGRARPSSPTPNQSGAADPHGELLRRAGRGDQDAFAELYDELAGVVNGVVRKVVRDPSLSDEVTQEVFVELWRLAARHEPSRGSVRTWAVTMAHRRAIDRVRSEQSGRDRIEREVRNHTVEYDEVADEVVEAASRSFEQARVRQVMDRLTPLQREAIDLAYVGGHTYREVAVLLEVAEGTVKTRIRDGMLRLRDELGGAS